MSLLKKYRKQMAFTLLATGAITIAPIDAFGTTPSYPDNSIGKLIEAATKTVDGVSTIDDTNAIGYSADFPDEVDVDIEDLAIDTNLNAALRFTELHISDILGLEFSKDQGYIDLLEDDDNVFSELKKMLSTTTISKSANPGLVEHLKSLTTIIEDTTDNVKKLKIEVGAGSEYKTLIDTLKAEIHYVDAHMDFSEFASVNADTANEKPFDFGDSTKTVNVSDPTTAVSIAISKDGSDVSENNYWVTQETYNALKSALDDAVETLMNVYKDTTILSDATNGFGVAVELLDSPDATTSAFSTFAAGNEFKNEVDTNGTALAMGAKAIALLPDETFYKIEQMLGTKENHTTAENIDETIAALEDAYSEYLAAEKGSAELADPAKFALDTKIALAMTGLTSTDAIAGTIPGVPAFEDSTTGIIYVYTNDTKAVDGSIPKSAATGIAAYPGTGALKVDAKDMGFDDDSKFFIAPVVTDDPYDLVTENFELADVEVTGEIPLKYITKAEANAKFKAVKAMVDEMKLYDGKDITENGGEAGVDTEAEYKAYRAEISAGVSAAAKNDYDADTKITLVAEKMAAFGEEMVEFAKMGTGAEQKIVANTLGQYLAHLGYATWDGTKKTYALVTIDTTTPAFANQKAVGTDNTEVAGTAPTEIGDIKIDPDTTSITAKTNFFNISTNGVDIPEAQSWVTVEERDALATVLLSAYELLKENQTKVNEITTIVAIPRLEAKIEEVKAAIAAYDAAAKEGLQDNFKEEVKKITEALATVEEFVTLPVFALEDIATEPTPVITEQRAIVATSKTALSNEGIFSITREVFTEAPAGFTLTKKDGNTKSAAYSDIQNQKLIDTTAIESYVTPADLDALFAAIDPVALLVSNETIVPAEGIVDVHSDAIKNAKDLYDDLVAKYLNGEIEAIVNKIETAVGVFEDAKKEVVSYAKRADLVEAIDANMEDSTKPDAADGSIRDLIRVDTGTVYIDPDSKDLMVSKDGGYTFVKYTPSPDNGATPSKWETVDEAPEKWVDEATLSAYNLAIVAAVKVVEDSKIAAYLVEEGTSPSTPSDDKKADAESTFDPDSTKPYAELKLNEDVLANILSAAANGEDYFEEAKKELDAAKEAFEKAAKEPVKTEAVEAKLEEFKTALEELYTIEEATDVTSRDTLGYVAAGTADDTKVTVAKFVDNNGTADDKTDDTIIGYFPAHIYVSDDTTGVINSVTGKAYGLNTSGESDGSAPKKYVNTRVSKNFIEAVQAAEEVKTKSLADLNKLITSNGKYFDNIIAKLTAEKVKFDEASKAYIDITAFNTAATAAQALIGAGTELSGDFTFKDAAGEEFVKGDVFEGLTIADGVIDLTTEIILGDTLVFSLDGIYECDENGVASEEKLETGTTTHWVTPTMFKNLKDAIIEAQELVNLATSLNEDIVYEYANTINTLNTIEAGLAVTGDTDADKALKAAGAAAVGDLELSAEDEENLIIAFGDDATEDQKTEATNIVGKLKSDYFTSQIDFTKVVTEFVPTTIEAVDEAAAGDWVKKAKVIIYGADEVAGGAVDTTNPDEPVDNRDALVSELPGGFDVLTLAALTAADTEEKDGDGKIIYGLSDAEITTAFGEAVYFEKTYIDALKAAIKVVEDAGEDVEAEEVEALALLVNQAPKEVKDVEIENNAKIDLYNSYVSTEALLMKDGKEVVASDNKGASTSKDTYWVTSAQLNGLKAALTNTEKLLNNTTTTAKASAIFNKNLVAQLTTNARLGAAFKPSPGTANPDELTKLNAAKAELLARINYATVLIGQKAYLEDGTQDENAVIIDEGRIVVSTAFGTDVSGEDKDGNLIPDSGDRWTSQAALNAATTAVKAAVNAYKHTLATETSLDKAQLILNNSIANFERTAQYGAKELYASVAATMQTYVNNIRKGNETYADGAIIAADQLAQSLLNGADVAVNQYWSTKLEVTKILNAATVAENVLLKFANPDKPTSKTSLPALVVSLNNIKRAYELFYGRDLEGKVIDEIVPKVQQGTNLVETSEIRSLIELSVAKVNDLVYLKGAPRPHFKYTLSDGTAGNSYGYDQLIPDEDYNFEKMEDGDDGNGNGIDEEEAENGIDIRVSSKANGIDVPTDTQWIPSVAVNQFVAAINGAQTSLDRFDMAADKVKNQIILTNAIAALEKANGAFDAAVKTSDSSISEASEAYQDSYKTLANSIIQGFSVLGFNENGVLEEDISMASGELAIEVAVRGTLSGDGGDVDSSYNWVPMVNYNGFKNAVIVAQTALNAPAANTKSLTSAYTILNNAATTLAKVASAKGEGRFDERDGLVSELQGLVDEANAILFGDDGETPIFTSATGKDVPVGEKWLTGPTISSLNAQVTLATNSIINAGTNPHPVTGLKGNGRTTINQLKTNIKTITTVLDKTEPKEGTLEGEMTDAAKARLILKAQIDQANEYVKTRISNYQGTELADGVIWVTGANVDGFKYSDTENADSIRPTIFISMAAKRAMPAYNKPYTAVGAKEGYEQASADLQSAIDQFENILANKTPSGAEVGADEPQLSGIGSLNSINAEKVAINAKMAEYSTTVKLTRVASEETAIAKLPEGVYYASATEIGTMNTAIATARTALGTFEKTVDAVEFLRDVVSADLTEAHDEFLNVRKMKGIYEETTMATAETAVKTLFDGEDENQIILPAGSTVASATAYIKNLVESVIANETITVDVIDAKITEPTAGTAEEPEGEAGSGTAKIKLTNTQAAEDADAADKEVTVDATFKVAATPYKWDAISKTNVLMAASKVHSKTEFVVDGAIAKAARDAEAVDADDDTKLAAEAKAVAADLKIQIENLINDSAIEVFVVAADSAEDNALTDAQNLTKITAATDDYDNQTPDTENKKGEDGKLEFNVALRLSFDEVPGILMIAEPAIVSELVEVTNDDAAGTGASDEYYTVIFKEALTAKVTAAPYTVSSPADKAAVDMANTIYTANVKTTAHSIENTLENPATTEALAKAQISKQITNLLTEGLGDNSTDEAHNYDVIEDVTFEIITTEFKAPTREAAGSFAFAVKFTQGIDSTSSADQTALAIEQNPEDVLGDFVAALESFPTFAATYVYNASGLLEKVDPKDDGSFEYEEGVGPYVLADKKATDKLRASSEMMMYLNAAVGEAIGGEAKVTIDDKYTAFKKALSATPAKAGIDGIFKFVAVVTDGDRTERTFQITIPIVALPYEKPEEVKAVEANLISLGVDLEAIGQFEEEEIPAFNEPVIEENYEDEFVSEYTEEFVEEELTFDEPAYEEEAYEEPTFDEEYFEEEYFEELFEEEEYFEEQFEEQFEEELFMEESFDFSASKNKSFIARVKNLFKRS
ncbi:hypothetical protein [Candidatus Epulonipiscium viviparus]|uniref:hypothetical protein n=1 Tax=Candidatus Epulonipiscium viviparus TaxID=420336 RepID=UPI00016C01A1|nr:hypothetical protein [Candidatus Epulopiscium viviparus]